MGKNDLETDGKQTGRGRREKEVVPGPKKQPIPVITEKIAREIHDDRALSFNNGMRR